MADFQQAKRSTVWEFFQRGEKKATCKICQKVFAYYGGTSNLKEHLQHVHPDTQQCAEDPVASPLAATKAGTRPIGSFGVLHSRRSCSHAKATQITELLADWVTDSMRPLNIVNDVRFKNLLQFLEQGYEVPSRTHLRAVIKKRYVETRKELTGLLQLQAPAIALTMDAWTSKAVQSFQTFTCHFVNDEWKLKTFVLETLPFGGSHTARRIADKACEAVARVRA